MTLLAAICRYRDASETLVLFKIKEAKTLKMDIHTGSATCITVPLFVYCGKIYLFTTVESFKLYFFLQSTYIIPRNLIKINVSLRGVRK